MNQVLRKQVFKAVLRTTFKPFLSPRRPVDFQRRWTDGLARSSPLPRGVDRRPVTLGGVPGLELRSRGADEARVVLFLHGGGYVIGGPKSHGALAARIGRSAGAVALLPDYRLAPEHPHPAALDDALAVYRALLDQGRKGGDIAIAGDSAGGGLSLSTAMAIRDAGLPPPAVLALLSPWVDLSLSGISVTERAARDPMLDPAWVRMCAGHYLGGLPAQTPACSPLFGNLAGLPPMRVQVGSEEILFSDSERLVQRVRQAGGQCDLEVYEGLWHDFQIQAGMLADADAAIASIGQFIRQQTSVADTP